MVAIKFDFDAKCENNQGMKNVYINHGMVSVGLERGDEECRLRLNCRFIVLSIIVPSILRCYCHLNSISQTWVQLKMDILCIKIDHHDDMNLRKLSQSSSFFRIDICLSEKKKSKNYIFSIIKVPIKERLLVLLRQTPLDIRGGKHCQYYSCPYALLN